MKAIARATVSAAALAALLVSTALQATPLAELPLKASVLAKPNVVWGLDDSSSMDSEVMLATNDGAFWWDYIAGKGWDAGGKPLFNPPGIASAQWRKMVYLFPNGTGDGTPAGARINDDQSNDHFAIMPTAQFAWLRSAQYNPLYYNPTVTYKPWSPAYVDGAMRTYANATPSAVKSHPVFGTRTMNLTADVALSQATDYTFMALPGMVIPKNAQYCTSNGSGGCSGGWTTVDAAAGYTVLASTVLRVAMQYTPATYYLKESCTVDGSTCVRAPDDATLKRYQPAAGSADMQNFANWWQYYRKRKLMLAAAMGQVLESLTGLRMGTVLFNNRSAPTVYDLDSASPAANGRALAATFYKNNTTGGTPTRETLKFIGDYYSGSSSPIQYACQRNNAFIVTDGFANVASVAPPAYAAAKWVSGAPYEKIWKNSLADIASSYYTNNPKSALAKGMVPKTAIDTNPDLHMNTYGLTLGATGMIFVDDTTPVPTSTSAWLEPSADRNPTAVDDLWHATINGRGRMYSAATPEETALRIRAGLLDIQDQQGAQGSVAVSAVNLDRGDSQAYLASYNPAGWTGDLATNPIDKTTGLVDMAPADQIWSATRLLSARNWSTRTIFSSSGSGGVGFDDANVGAAALPGGAAFTSAQLVDFLRGNSAGEGTLFRDRSRTTTVGGATQTLHHLIGPVINAEPVLARDEKMVYVASGEGMLHAFDTVTGKEEWAYAPPDALAGMGASAVRGWVFQTLLDATPAYGKLSNGSKMLIGGMGAAGRSYYALDVSNPKNLGAASAAAQFRWVFPAAGDTANRALMGYTVGKPVIVKTGPGTDRILVTSGYDNATPIGDGKGRLWMLDASGNVVKSFVTSAGAVHPGQEAGLAHVSAFKEPDGTVRYVYGGDLLGNLWRFDLQKAGTTDIAADLVAVFKDASVPTPKLQPVTASPELASVGGKRIILIGTGRILDIGDFGSSATQSFYAVADGAMLSNARSGLVQQVYTRGGTPELTANAVDWSSDRGWYFDLPAGEQVNADPIVTYGAVAFVTNKNGGADCSQQSYLYLVDIGTGTKVADSTFVAETISLNATASRVITLRVVNGKIVGMTHKSDNTVFTHDLPLGQTINPSKNAWREIRR